MYFRPKLWRRMEFEIKHEDKFQYIEEGNGHPIVLLHGLFGALSNFRDVINHFSDNYKVVIPLLPIYELPVKETSVASLAEFLKEFLEHKGYDKVTLLGNSLGGHVALVYTVAYPAKVHSMVLTGSSGLYESAMGDTFPRRGDKDYIKDKVKLTFYDPINATDELVEEVFEIVNNREKVLRTLALSKSAIRHNMRDELKNIQIPVCLIWGKNDTVTPPQVADEFHELLPQSDLYWIEKCAHAPMMERPQEFNKYLGDWLDKLFAK